MNLTDEKNFLRTKYKDIRNVLKKETITENITKKSALDRDIFENLIHHIDFRNYKSILCYVSFGIEVDTRMLIDYLQEKNMPLYAPKCYTHDKSMRFFSINNTDSLISGEYKGILEPIEDTSNELLDFSNCLCIVPALAFDNQGYRLGWGGGYYDRFLASNSDIFKVGLTYNSCMTETIPKDIYDISVDIVVTEKNILLFGGTNEH